MKLHLFIDTIKMGMYNVIRQAKLEDIPDEFGDLFKMLLAVSNCALQSKQCNEPYERLLAEILNLKSNPSKHGWDAWNKDTEELSTEFYEFKP